MSTFFSFPAKPTPLTRRGFLRKSLLATSLLAASAPAFLRGQNLNSKLNIAGIGCGGKGDSDVKHCESENIVAICDIDHAKAAGAIKRNPNARLFKDYRKMFDEMGKNIDAVTVSTPDHHHACAAAMAMKMKKHAYVQKPLTHSVFEARTLRKLAKDTKVITQMGNQGSSYDGLRRAVEVIRAGIIGKPQELHVWSNRPIWPQGIDRPSEVQVPPDGLDWDLFLGPAPERPFNKAYHPFGWRGWKDFGTGALGDMACHTVNMPFRALKLGYPSAIECEAVSDTHAETYPKSSRLRFEFPKRAGLPALKFWWYDGSPKDTTLKIFRPHPDLTGDILDTNKGQLPASGCLIIGEKGRIYSPDDYGAKFQVRLNYEKAFRPSTEHEAVMAIPQKAVMNAHQGDADPKQHLEWIAAIKANKPSLCYSNFDIAAYLTEIILLGCVAMNVGTGKKLIWDGPNMKAKNIDVSRFVHREYRKGWKL
jgi:predicted dehydrogenase